MGLRDKLADFGAGLKIGAGSGARVIHGKDILAALEKEAARRKKIFREKIIVPDVYTVCLCRDDLHDFATFLKALKKEILAEFNVFLKKKNLVINAAAVELGFKARPAQESGTLKVESGFSTPTLTPPGEDQAVLMLVINSGVDPPEQVSLGPGDFTLGRGREATVPMPADDMLVSKRHCAITVAVGQMTVRDLDSRNGTFINGKKCIGVQDLQNGDVLVIGDTRIEVAC